MAVVGAEIPLALEIGESASWRRSFADYTDAGGWALTYELLGPSKLDVAGVPNGDAFDFALTSAASATLVEGVHDWTLYATDGAEVVALQRGEVEILPSVAAGVAPADARSHARRVLDLVEAKIEGRVVSDQESFSLVGRSLNRIPIADLLNLRTEYAAIVKREERREAVKRGKTQSHQIAVRLP